MRLQFSLLDGYAKEKVYVPLPLLRVVCCTNNIRIMNTISVTVTQANQALMLAEWLKNIRFVKEVNVEINNSSEGNAKEIKRALNSIKSKCMLSEIKDPIAYQRQIRDEWE